MGLKFDTYDNGDPKPNVNQYETDLVILDYESEQSWKPRVIVEAKKGSVTTHDAITYSQKALSHKGAASIVRRLSRKGGPHVRARMYLWV